MEKINFGFEIKQKSSFSKQLNDSSFLNDQNIKEIFGSKSFETSWQFIETLA